MKSITKWGTEIKQPNLTFHRNSKIVERNDSGHATTMHRGEFSSFFVHWIHYTHSTEVRHTRFPSDRVNIAKTSSSKISSKSFCQIVKIFVKKFVKKFAQFSEVNHEVLFINKIEGTTILKLAMVIIGQNICQKVRQNHFVNS